MIPLWEILSQCVTQCQDGTKIDLTGEDSSDGIPDAHILAVKVPYSRDQRERFAITPRPALVFSPGTKINSPASAGNNKEKVVFYPVLAQILHTSLSVHTDVTLKNILKWEYQVRRYFDMNNLRGAVFDDGGKVTLAPVTEVDVFNDKMFHIFDDCVAAIPIVFKCLEPHNADGRV